MNEYQIGNFGLAKFTIDKKGFKGLMECYGKIKDIDGKYLLFEDNDGYNYLIRKDKFTFEQCEFRVKT
jgi:hypothetical protein